MSYEIEEGRDWYQLIQFDKLVFYVPVPYILHLTDSCPFPNLSISEHGLELCGRYNLAGGLF
jgi:hypothetical protein